MRINSKPHRRCDSCPVLLQKAQSYVNPTVSLTMLSSSRGEYVACLSHETGLTHLRKLQRKSEIHSGTGEETWELVSTDEDLGPSMTGRNPERPLTFRMETVSEASRVVSEVLIVMTSLLMKL